MIVPRHLKLAVLGLSVLLLLGVVWILTFPRTAKPSVTVQFVGFTNDVAGAKRAVFRVSNDGQSRVFRWGLYRMQTSDSQQSPIVAPKSRYLDPGAAELMILDVASFTNRWRAMFNFSPDSPHLRLSEAILKIRGEGIPVRSFQFCSDWISE